MNDLFYGLGVWIIMRFNKVDAAMLLEHWARGLKREYPEITKELN